MVWVCQATWMSWLPCCDDGKAETQDCWAAGEPQSPQNVLMPWDRERFSTGIVPFFNCFTRIPNDIIPLVGALGWPCPSGGSVAVAAEAVGGNGPLKNCLVIFHPLVELQLTPTVVQARLTQFRIARHNCLTDLWVPVDLTDLALCIYSNYPQGPLVAPTRFTSTRLKGLAVILSPLVEVNAALIVQSGFLVVERIAMGFHVGQGQDLNQPSGFLLEVVGALSARN